MLSQDHLSLPAHLKNIVFRHTKAKVCWIAYSGGMDSHVLLQIAATIKHELKVKLAAVHVCHGLSRNAVAWEQHCSRTCQGYGIEFKSFSIDLSEKGKHGIEALAREKRYAIFRQLLNPHDLLLTAHHMNDQIETVLLQLMRGSGPDGLVGIAPCKLLGRGQLIRPLLDCSHQTLYDYAVQASLQWIEDESNLLDSYDRNFLRHHVIPPLLKRWPGALQTVKRSAGHQVENISLIDEISSSDLKLVCDSDFSKIHLPKFNTLSLIRKKHVLRAWFKHNKLPIPNARLITTIEKDMIHAHADRNPCIKWQEAEIRRYRDCLYIMPSLPKHDGINSIVWRLRETVELGDGCLSAIVSKGNGIKMSMIFNDVVEIRYRQGGEKIKLSGHKHVKKLKNLFQAIGLPPWLRDRVPLIFYKDHLIAVVDLWLSEPYVAAPSESSWQIKWQPVSKNFMFSS